MFCLTTVEHKELVDAVEDAYVECEACVDISQGVVDKLETARFVLDALEKLSD